MLQLGIQPEISRIRIALPLVTAGDHLVVHKGNLNYSLEKGSRQRTRSTVHSYYHRKGTLPLRNSDRGSQHQGFSIMGNFNSERVPCQTGSKQLGLPGLGANLVMLNFRLNFIATTGPFRKVLDAPAPIRPGKGVGQERISNQFAYSGQHRSLTSHTGVLLVIHQGQLCLALEGHQSAQSQGAKSKFHSHVVKELIW